MGDIIFNILWWALVIWTGLMPDGYAPYLMLGFNVGNLMATLYFGIGQGYLKEEGDFDLGAFLLSTLGFIFLGGFYIGGLSFKPGSDPYNNALCLAFFTFLLTFAYRYIQYAFGRYIKQPIQSVRGNILTFCRMLECQGMAGNRCCLFQLAFQGTFATFNTVKNERPGVRLTGVFAICNTSLVRNSP